MCVCVCVYSCMTKFICMHDHWINNSSVLPMPWMLLASWLTFFWRWKIQPFINYKVMKPILLTVRIHIKLCIIMSVNQKMKHHPACQWGRSTRQSCISITRNYKSGIQEKQINFTWKWHVCLSTECNSCTSETLLSLGFSVNAASHFLLNLPTTQENKTKQTMKNVKACSSYTSLACFF